jgi:hypothetical protein
LAGQFAAAFPEVKIGRLHDWAVIFVKAIPSGDPAPTGEKIVYASAVLGIEVAKAWKGVHGLDTIPRSSSIHVLLDFSRKVLRTRAKHRMDIVG